MSRLLNVLRTASKSLRTVYVPSALVLASFFYVAPAACGQNLLANPGFEDGLEGWTVAQSGAGTVTTSTTAHDGLLAAYVSVPPIMVAGASISQDVRVRRGARYCISGWLQPLITGGGFSLQVWTGALYPVDLLVYGAGGEWGWSQACWLNERRTVRVIITARAGLVAGGGLVDSLALVESAQ